MNPLYRNPSHFPLYHERRSFIPSLITIYGYRCVEISPAKYISIEEFQKIQDSEKTSRVDLLTSGLVGFILGKSKS